MYLKIIFSFIILLFFKTNLLYALSQDISLTIMVRSTLGTEYILAKSICKVLDRELKISHSYGGSNTLECDTRLDDSVDEIIKKIEQNQFQYAIIKKSDLFERPSNLSLRSILNFPADNDYVFISNQNVDPNVIKDINFGIMNHLLEFRYLHNSFFEFSESNLIVKQKIPLHLGTLKFSDEWSNGKRRRFTEVD
ncbi:hypothetical protein OA954_04770 [Alphaproteobacteria bacterium]|nr:hypothetical protein [Alphaproteobacteria bacterium]